MSVEMNQDPAQSNEPERREAQGARVPFGGAVEVGGALGPSFEAHAIDVSEEGIHLRTAYLPELGQPLTCRIEVGKEVVLAAGEVVWRQEADRGGEFGLRFAELDAASESALKKLVAAEPKFDAHDPGTRVRLHIEGLGSPMRARIKGSAAEGLVVGSELGFLQVGKELELEDARTGGKRAARIDKVTVEVNPETHIPQLVVSLRYDVSDTDVPGQAAATGPDDTPEPSVIDDDNPRATVRAGARASKKASDESEEDPFGPMRSGVGEAFHRASAQVGPALSRFGAQAATAFALVAARAKKATTKTDDVAPKTRRTTAPAPTGGLHATGRKVVRTDRMSAMDAVEDKQATPIAKRRMAVGSAILVACVLAFAALHKPASTAQTAPTDPASPVAVGALGASAPPAPVTPALPATSGALLPPTPALAPVPPEDNSVSPAPLATDDSHSHKKPLRVTPFGSGAVGHANVLHLKMDGPIEKIEGATTPTGFTVVIPARRSLEAAAPLASRDSRIAAIRITNESSGAELSLNFKDGVPNYQVRAKGDLLEILLAPQGKLADADESTKPTKKKHTQHH
jgi:hypothetical protein